jgi:hypothetical protein
VIACAAVACGGRAPAVVVPERAVTAGDALLARLPAGAAIVLEVDVARLRANPVVGALVEALVVPPGEGQGVVASVTEAPLAGARAVVLAAYDVGTARATTITLVAGTGAPPRAVVLADGIWALASDGDVARLVAVTGGAPSLAGDRELLALRARPMPAAAEGASARLTARLDPTARRALATLLARADAPAAMAAWLDVADDLALVAWIGDDRGQWPPVLEALRDRLAATLELRVLGLGPPVAESRVGRGAGAARLTLVVSPGRLRRATERALAHLRAVGDGHVVSPP